MLKLKVTEQPINITEILDSVSDASCGAVTMFQGTIRNHNQGDKVLMLEYETYEALLQNECDKIYDEIAARWKVHAIAITQRTGQLEIGDTGIAICVSSAHRRDSLEALDYCIEQFKKRAPVWKKEHLEAGNRWINWTD